jgi:hypothetical protein
MPRYGGRTRRRENVQAVIVLFDAVKEEISDYYTVTPPEGQTLIVFNDQAKLDEVLAAVTKWAAPDGLVAGAMSLEASTFDHAVQLVILMSPHMSDVRFITDSDPFVDQLLAHIRG